VKLILGRDSMVGNWGRLRRGGDLHPQKKIRSAWDLFAFQTTHQSLSRVKPESLWVKELYYKYSSMTEKQKHKMISQQNTQISTRSHLHATATVLEPRKSLTFLRVSPGGCSGVEKLIVGILLFSSRHTHIQNSNDYTLTTFINRNHLRVITAISCLQCDT
jgi:hypothetical protein